VSDLHLSDYESPDPTRPGWRAYKRPEAAPDDRLLALLEHVRELAVGEPVELVFAGDTFDFDTIVALPEEPSFDLSWLERKRGLAPEEARSAWKMRRILADHAPLVEALRAFLADGHTLVFIVGNHDLELHWPAVQAELRAALDPPRPEALAICEFFRISADDTLVMHGNQLDAYCVCHDPLHPFVEIDGRRRVRSPFGNVAGKLMLNGMGLLNPHVEASFIRPFREYVSFFFKYLARIQPLIGFTWFWTALATLWVSVREGLRPDVRDPASLEDRIDDAARRANATPRLVRALRDVRVHPAVFSPLRVARELWLDRAGLLLGLVAIGYQIVTALHWAAGASPWWIVPVFCALFPIFLVYARSCRSEVADTEENILQHVATLAGLARVRRVVMGHTHRAGTWRVGDVTLFNTGHWSPAFDDVECEKPVGTNGFVWIRPAADGRVAELRTPEGDGSRILGDDAAEPQRAARAVGAA
jgi:UDP-2,3-diacylglucosamine pyrophosphatase LpxH